MFKSGSYLFKFEWTEMQLSRPNQNKKVSVFAEGSPLVTTRKGGRWSRLRQCTERVRLEGCDIIVNRGSG